MFKHCNCTPEIYDPPFSDQVVKIVFFQHSFQKQKYERFCGSHSETKRSCWWFGDGDL